AFGPTRRSLPGEMPFAATVGPNGPPVERSRASRRRECERASMARAGRTVTRAWIRGSYEACAHFRLGCAPMHRCMLACALALAGCAVPAAADLDESDANRILIALDHAKIDATKETDPGEDGKLRVTVGRDDVARALFAMQGEGLPRPQPRGVLDTIDKGA